MAVRTYAAIYIGTYHVSMKVFEISSKRQLRTIDYLRKRLDIGRDAFSQGAIGYELVDELCDTLAEFKSIAQAYHVEHLDIHAAAALRMASNELFVQDQISLRTGLNVKVLSNSEHRFISYEAVAGRESFEEMIRTSAVVVDVGGASTQITIFREGHLIVTQHIEAGTMRVREILGDCSKSLRLYEMQIEEYMNKKLERFITMYLTEPVASVILISDYGTELIRSIDKDAAEKCIKSEKFLQFIGKLQKKTIEEISAELNLPDERDPLIIPSIILFKSLVENIRPTEVWVPGIGIEDGMAYDYGYRNKILKNSHDFDADVISAAEYMSLHYSSYSPHIDALLGTSVRIFDILRKEHGLGKRERLLLQVATILHDCGKFISLYDSAETAYQIIMSSELIGLTHLERAIVALTVLYNANPLDDYEELSDELDRESYLVVAKLSAILRLANALDQSHKQKFKNIKIALRGRELMIQVESLADISLEQTLFAAKTAYFEKIFSIKPVLKEKRVYSV